MTLFSLQSPISVLLQRMEGWLSLGGLSHCEGIPRGEGLHSSCGFAFLLRAHSLRAHSLWAHGLWIHGLRPGRQVDGSAEAFLGFNVPTGNGLSPLCVLATPVPFLLQAFPSPLSFSLSL